MVLVYAYGAVTESNPPFTNIVTLAEYGGFGVDTAGAFSGQPIDFSDTTPFENGIGAHPNSSIDFNLVSLRNLESFNSFQAVIGIDTNGGTSTTGGATFEVFLDGIQAFSFDVTDLNVGSFDVWVPIGNESTLTLNTSYYNGTGTNWAAWGDARLATTAIPEPSSAALLILGTVAATLLRTRRLSIA